MNIPNTINILGKDFAINHAGNLRQPDGQMACGHMNVDDQVISLNPVYHKQNVESTLIHEILEAINELMKINLAHDQICQLETGLHQVLKDNQLHFNEE